LQYCTQDEINLECGGRANPVTPLSLAVENDADDFVSLLCEQKVKLRTECTNSQVCKDLLIQWLNYSLQKLTPLHMCCKKGNEKLLKMLLDKGANVNVTSSDGNL
jgi:ankyrin repeat protein